MFLIAGPCAIESRDMVMHTAETLKQVCERLGITLYFKSSYDKANRTSISERGVGMEKGLAIFHFRIANIDRCARVVAMCASGGGGRCIADTCLSVASDGLVGGCSQNRQDSQCEERSVYGSMGHAWCDS